MVICRLSYYDFSMTFRSASGTVGGFVAAAILAIAVTRLAAAEQTWTGQLSDSLCGASHAGMSRGSFSDAECTVACVDSGGKWVLVTGGKVLQIDNQTFDGLKSHAGQTVKVTGEWKDSNQTVITVDKIEPVADKSQ